MQSRYEYDYARRGDQAGGGVDRETVKTTCTFFRSCSWLVGGGGGVGGRGKEMQNLRLREYYECNYMYAASFL